MAASIRKHLVVVIDATGNMHSVAHQLKEHGLDPVAKNFLEQNHADPQHPAVEATLVLFRSHPPYSDFIVEVSPSIHSLQEMETYLSHVQFEGGGLSDIAVGEGLLAAYRVLQHYSREEKFCLMISNSTPKPGGCISVGEPEYIDMKILERWFKEAKINYSYLLPRKIPALTEWCLNTDARSREASAENGLHICLRGLSKAPNRPPVGIPEPPAVSRPPRVAPTTMEGVMPTYATPSVVVMPVQTPAVQRPAPAQHAGVVAPHAQAHPPTAVVPSHPAVTAQPMDTSGPGAAAAGMGRGVVPPLAAASTASPMQITAPGGAASAGGPLTAVAANAAQKQQAIWTGSLCWNKKDKMFESAIPVGAFPVNSTRRSVDPQSFNADRWGERLTIMGVCSVKDESIRKQAEKADIVVLLEMPDNSKAPPPPRPDNPYQFLYGSLIKKDWVAVVDLAMCGKTMIIIPHHNKLVGLLVPRMSLNQNQPGSMPGLGANTPLFSANNPQPGAVPAVVARPAGQLPQAGMPQVAHQQAPPPPPAAGARIPAPVSSAQSAIAMANQRGMGGGAPSVSVSVGGPPIGLAAMGHTTHTGGGAAAAAAASASAQRGRGQMPNYGPGPAMVSVSAVRPVATRPGPGGPLGSVAHPINIDGPSRIPTPPLSVNVQRGGPGAPAIGITPATGINPSSLMMPQYPAVTAAPAAAPTSLLGVAMTAPTGNVLGGGAGAYAPPPPDPTNVLNDADALLSGLGFLGVDIADPTGMVMPAPTAQGGAPTSFPFS